MSFGFRFLVLDFQFFLFSVFSCQILVFKFRFSVFGFRFSDFICRILVFEFRNICTITACLLSVVAVFATWIGL